MTPETTRAPRPLILPNDPHNQELLAQTHPSGWVNPTPKGRYHLVVIGAGTAGLTVAAGCAAIGGRVALIERHLTGGDCLVTGCVPSKALIKSARVAATVRQADAHGIRIPNGVIVDGAAVLERMRRLRARIAPADSVHHLTKVGVDVFLGQATFTGPDRVEISGQTLTFARAVIATGARAAVPPIVGLREVPFLTNETVFQLTAIPARFAMIGAGPIGCEMAQTFARLGSWVTLIDTAPHVLIREDADAAEVVQQALIHDGVELILDAAVKSVRRSGQETTVALEQAGKNRELACDALLVGVGRTPNTDGLNLEAAGVAYDKAGVVVNDFLQTSNPRIYAAGDVCTPFKFTHTANALGRMAMVNALISKWAGGRMNRLVVPWCTYTDPEVAHVGLYEAQARERGIAVHTITVPLVENDRAVLDGEDEGFIRVHLRQGTDRLLGATIVASHAGDLLSYFTLVMASGRGLSSLTKAIYPYPTQSEIIKRVANAHLQTKLSPSLKRMFSWWISRLR